MNPSEPSEGLFFSAFSRTSPSLRKGFRIALPARRRLSNSVGYQNLGVKTENMFNYKVATFDRVDGTTMKLRDLKVDENFGAAYLNFLRPNGTTKTFEIPEIIAEGGDAVSGIMYISAADAEDAGLDEPGRYFPDVSANFCSRFTSHCSLES